MALHIDDSIRHAIGDAIAERRPGDLFLFIPRLADEEIVIAFGSGVVTANTTPYLALATSQKSRGQTFASEGMLSGSLMRLNDEIVMFERSTGREYLIMMVPLNPKQGVVMTRNGIPYPMDMTPEEVLAFFMMERDRS